MTRLDRVLKCLAIHEPVHDSIIDAMLLVTIGGYVAGFGVAHYLASIKPISTLEVVPVFLAPLLVIPFGVIAFRRIAHPHVMLDDWLERTTYGRDDRP